MDDQKKKAEEALKQAQAASKSAEEAVQQIKSLNQSDSASPASTPPPSPQYQSQQPISSVPDADQPKNTAKQAVSQVAQSTEEIKQAADNLQSKTKAALPKLEAVEKNVNEAEKTLTQQLQGEKKGSTIAGY